MSDLLGIGLSGLRVSRNNLSVTGHNISNIDTPGFSRQRAVQITNQPQGSAGGYVGRGARTITIERIQDQYVNQQMRVDTSRLKDTEAFLRNINELDSLLSNESSALGRALNSFFEATQTVINDPLSRPARELMFSQATSVSQRFNTAQSRLNDQANNINTQLRTYAQRVNEMTQAVAQLNAEIKVYEGTRNQPPNDLLDRRDEKLRELSELIDVTVVEQDARDVHVFIGNGIPLIVGEDVNKIEASPSLQDPGRFNINLIDRRGSAMDVTRMITGGEMGGVLRYRTDTLDPAMSELGRIAMVFAGEFNNQHRSGVDLDGNQGEEFFRDVNTREYMLDRLPGIQRTAPAGVWFDPEGLGKLPAQEFSVKRVDGEFLLSTHPGGQRLAAPFATIADLNTHLQDNYGFRLTDGSAWTHGDPPPGDLDASLAQFNEALNEGLLLAPTRNGAAELARSPLLNSANKIALAGLAPDENNVSRVKLTYQDLPFNLTQAGLNGHEVRVVDAGAGTFELLDNTGTATAIAVNYDAANSTLTLVDADGLGNDIVLNVSGDDFVDGDRWLLEGAAGGTNGAALAGLQLDKLIDQTGTGSGGSSLSEAYSMLVERVGIQSSEARTATEVNRAVLNQTTAMRESASGVNMDEEAANLIRFQQAYQASTQIIAAAQRMFDTLLASVGR